jgi:hypothetical protein
VSPNVAMVYIVGERNLFTVLFFCLKIFLGTQNYWVFGLCLSSGILKNGENQFSENFGNFVISIFLEYWMMDKFQKTQ